MLERTRCSREEEGMVFPFMRGGLINSPFPFKSLASLSTSFRPAFNACNADNQKRGTLFY